MTGQPTALPPFSGDEPICPKCGHADAYTHYRTNGIHVDCTSLCPPGEHLDRECSRCDYTWPEATVQTAAAGTGEQGPNWAEDLIDQPTPDQELHDAKTIIEQAGRVASYWKDKATRGDPGRNPENGAVAHACAMIMFALVSVEMGADTLAQLGLPISKGPEHG